MLQHRASSCSLSLGCCPHLGHPKAEVSVLFTPGGPPQGRTTFRFPNDARSCSNSRVTHVAKRASAGYFTKSNVWAKHSRADFPDTRCEDLLRVQACENSDAPRILEQSSARPPFRCRERQQRSRHDPIPALPRVGEGKSFYGLCVFTKARSKAAPPHGFDPTRSRYAPR